MNRAERRHRANLAKRRVKSWWWIQDLLDGAFKHPKWVGRLSITPHSCSCGMCRNPRYREGPTLQELKAPKADEWDY